MAEVDGVKRALDHGLFMQKHFTCRFKYYWALCRRELSMKIFHNIVVIASFVLSIPLTVIGIYTAFTCMARTTGAYSVGAIAAAAGAFIGVLIIIAGSVFLFLSFYSIAHPLRAGVVWVAIVIGITLFIIKGAQPDISIYLGLLIFLLCGSCLIATGIFMH